MRWRDKSKCFANDFGFPAVINEVDAIVRRLAKPMLLTEDFGEISPKWPEIASCFPSEKAYATARGTLLKGDGIGSGCGTGISAACFRFT